MAVSAIKKGFPAFRLKMLVVLFLTIFFSIVLDNFSRSISFGMMHRVINWAAIMSDIGESLLMQAIPPVVVLGAILMVYISPLYKTTYALYSGESVSEDQKRQGQKIIQNLPVLVTVVNLVAYTVGTLAVVGFKTLFSMSGVFILIGEWASALVFSLIQINLFRIILSKPRRLLQIYSVHGINEDTAGRKGSIVQRNMMAAVATVIFVVFTLMQMSIEIVVSEMHFSRTLEAVVSGKMSLDEARTRYKEEAAEMMEVSPDLIEFPYDVPEEDRPDPWMIFFAGIFDLLIIAGFIQYVQSKFQVRQLGAINEKIEAMAKGTGDLTQRVEITEFDEVGTLASSINDFLRNQQTLLSSVADMGEKVKKSSDILLEVLEHTASATEEMVASVSQTSTNAITQAEAVERAGNNLKDMLSSLDQISENVDSQATFVEQTSSAVNEMAANIQSVNETTSQANQLSGNLVAVSKKGGEAVQRSIQAVREVETSSEEVNGIVSVITKIAAQTNMLAMNAAIEAAHAGVAGRGFAVVAQEVRNLAENSSASAKQIAGLIKDMVETVNNGVQQSENAGKALQKVSEDTDRASNLMNEISAAMEEQNIGATEILGSIQSLVQSSQDIRTITQKQKDTNTEMRHAVEQVVNVFQEIRMASEEQAAGNEEIVKGIGQLKEVVNDNDEAVKNLQSLIVGFKLK